MLVQILVSYDTCLMPQKGIQSFKGLYIDTISTVNQNELNKLTKCTTTTIIWTKSSQKFCWSQICQHWCRAWSRNMVHPYETVSINSGSRLYSRQLHHHWINAICT